MRYVLNVLAAEDLEAGMPKKKLQTEPTLPIYLKVPEVTSFFQIHVSLS